MLKKREESPLRIEYLKESNEIEIRDIRHSDKVIKFHSDFAIYLIQELNNCFKFSRYVKKDDKN